MKDGIYRNTCPRNCYCTCGMLSHVKDNQLVKVTGDPKHGFNQGKLCAKGYASTQYVYNPERLRYPMKQVPRGSGNWVRISWDEAYTTIADKIVELYNRYGSHLACGYNKYSGNLGILHYATEGMFNSLGPHTKPVGNVCGLTGRNANHRSFGTDFSSVPEKMAKAKLIVLWGANPAATNVHQMRFIYEARRNGAQLVVIDPVYTETAKKADLYIQLNPGTDVYLALAIAKMLIEKGTYDQSYVENHVEGWHEYREYLEREICIEDTIKKTGVVLEAIEELVNMYSMIKPAVTYNGLGIQRNEKGSLGLRAINSVAALTGNLEAENGGVYYLHSDLDLFPLKILNIEGPQHPSIEKSRELNISLFAKDALALKDPPLKMLWIASRNIFTQDHHLHEWEQLLEQQELIVAVDLFMTKTVSKADIVLPAASQFEEEDLNFGYWHYWLSFNEKAIPPFYEAKSDLAIARELMKKLNEIQPGLSTFPTEKEPIDWINEELTDEIKEIFAISSFEDLLLEPKMKNDQTRDIFKQRKFQLFSEEEKAELLQYVDEETKEGYFRLFTPQSVLRIHSQFDNVAWLQDGTQDESFIEIPEQAAIQLDIENNSKIIIYNDFGSYVGKARLNPLLPNNIVIATQAGKKLINHLINDNHKKSETLESVYFYNNTVQIKKWRNSNV